MKYCKLIIIALFSFSFQVYSQEQSIKHTVTKGESISSIAKKYHVSNADIYKLNPEAKKTLQLNQVLLIPSAQSKQDSDLSQGKGNSLIEVKHQLLPKETLYGICKQYKTTAELLYKANPKLEAEGLKVGKTLVIPTALSKEELAALTNGKAPDELQEGESTAAVQHEVKAKESLYSIARLYSVTVKELQELNPQLGNKSLGIGQLIQIPAKKTAVAQEAKREDDHKEEVIAKNQKLAETKVTDSTSKPVTKSAELPLEEKPISEQAVISHIVVSKETKYGIAKMYGISVAELEKQNPSVQNKLLVGSTLRLKVPADKMLPLSTAEGTQKTVVESETAVAEVKDSAKVSMPIAHEELIDKIIETASENIGVRYRSGGTTNAGFDCSGLMYTAFGACDIKLPRSSIEQASIGEKVADMEAQKGDLIFFKTNGRRQINHVGMVVDVQGDEIKFIHSATHSGVIISSTKEPYYQRNFVQVNRVIK